MVGEGGVFKALKISVAVAREEDEVIKSGTLSMRQRNRLFSCFIWTVVWRNFDNTGGIFVQGRRW
jgi:hypothetical protein